jgi:uncharacterized repeat protein (TIGR01451 family)
VSDDNDVPVSQTRTLDLTKTAIVKVIEYNFVIKNTGNTTLTGVQLTDLLVNFDNATCPTVNGVTTLAPGAFTSCTATHNVTALEIEAGFVENTATANANDNVVSPEAKVKVPVKFPLPPTP